MVRSTDVRKLVQALQQLPVQHVDESEFLYGHLSQCILSAVFSLGAKAEAERNVVLRYTNWADLSPALRTDRTTLLPTSQQEPVDWFIQHIEDVGMHSFTDDILQNRQRTSTFNGILKSEAVYLFARVLAFSGVVYFQDLYKIVGDDRFEGVIKQIKGQGSGLSLNYFYMLTTFEQYAKADRHVTNFVTRVIGRKPTAQEIYQLIVAASQQLNLSPRVIDVMIWTYMRSQPP